MKNTVDPNQASVAHLDVSPTGDQEVAGSTPAGSTTFFFFSWRFDHEIFSTVILSIPLIQGQSKEYWTGPNWWQFFCRLHFLNNLSSEINVKKIAFGNKEHTTDKKMGISVLLRHFISSNEVCNTAYAL